MRVMARNTQPITVPNSLEPGVLAGGDLVSSSTTTPHPSGVGNSILTSPFSYEIDCGSALVVEQYSVKEMDCVIYVADSPHNVPLGPRSPLKKKKQVSRCFTTAIVHRTVSNQDRNRENVCSSWKGN